MYTLFGEKFLFYLYQVVYILFHISSLDITKNKTFKVRGGHIRKYKLIEGVLYILLGLYNSRGLAYVLVKLTVLMKDFSLLSLRFVYTPI